MEQIYPNKSIAHLRQSYQRFGKVCVGGSIVGSTLPGGNGSSSSVIMAYWAGNLLAIGSSRMRVGVVQLFLSHKVSFYNDSTGYTENMYAYALWKKLHPHANYLNCQHKSF